MPFEEGVESKVTYAEYFEPWDWIVAVSTYRKDFSKERNRFVYMIVLSMFFIVISGYFIAKKHISSITMPLMAVVEAMKSLS